MCPRLLLTPSGAISLLGGLQDGHLGRFRGGAGRKNRPLGRCEGGRLDEAAG